jgi:hypothetical protein
MKSFKKILGCFIILATLVLAILEVKNLIAVDSTAHADPTNLIVIIVVGGMLSMCCFLTMDLVIPLTLLAVGVAVFGVELYWGIGIFTMVQPVYGDISNTTAGIIHLVTGVILSSLIFWVSSQMFKDMIEDRRKRQRV